MSHNNQTDMVKNRKAIKIKNGKAVSIGNDLYYMQGPSHELGGIDVGKNLEVEGGEVMQINKDNIKVFSAQPILNGISPAEKILGGGSPNKVFNEQERYKDRNRLNDDGSIKSSSTGGRDRAKRRNRTITKDLNIMNEQYKCGGKSKKSLGGLNRSKDYGSKDKPYPKVKSSDFAGGGRSYPIPTKADAIDALRLAGLHGRSDVRAKVYKKYPELKKRNGGVITINGNVIDKLISTPRKAKLGAEDKFRNKDLEKIKRDMSFNDYTSDINTNFRLNNNNWFNKFKSIRPDDYINIIKPTGVINNSNIDDSRITKEFPRRGYSKLDDIIVKSNNTVKSNNNSTNTNSNKSTIRKTKPNTNKSIKTNNNSSNIRLTKFPSITQAGITIPKTDINNIRLNNFVSQEDANAGFKKEQSDADDKIKKYRKRNLINDIIGTGANVIGSGLSYANTRRALKNMQAPAEPIYEQPQKLVTDYNINPQLSDIEEQTKQMMDVIGANTATGRARIQRVQRAINAGLSSKNQLRGQKENIETQLKNADIMNRQSVNARNIAARNAWQNNVINFQNNIREQLASNRNNLYSGINASIQDMLTRRENRRQYNNTLGIYAATHPNVNRKIFEQYGVEF